MTVEEAIEHIYELNVGRIGDGSNRHERPHKPLLLLAVLDLIDAGLATPDRIPWCQQLRDRFSTRFELVANLNDQNTPENPFFYLKNDAIWEAWLEQSGQQITIETTPLVKQMGYIFARFQQGFDSVISIAENRWLIRDAIISRYFPKHPELRATFAPKDGHPDDLAPSKVVEEDQEYGRCPAFRRTILKIYDHQCAACGLRIILPEEYTVSFIDAAHLIPFAESHNDHPTNGLALCKNHHWAMDRNIIAPGADLNWHVSSIIDPRRSNGEKELHELKERPVLLPQDEAYRPGSIELEWRMDKLLQGDKAV